MRTQRQAGRRRNGSTIVEFALVVPILITIFLGIMEGGWLVKNNMQVANAARIGARWASLGYTTTSVQSLVAAKASPLTVTTTVQHSVDGGQTFVTTGNNGTVGNNAPFGAMMTVTVRHRHRPLTGFFPFLQNRDVVAKAQFGRE